MPTTCGFPNCKFRSRYKGCEDNRHFYRVPKKPAALRDKWLEAIGRTEANIVSQLRICSGHFHGGEKREGDIPVADPAVDPPKRIEVPSKNLRLHVSSFSAFVRSSTSHYRRGGSSVTSVTQRFRSLGRGRGGVSIRLLPPLSHPQPPPPPLPTSPLMSSQTLSAVVSSWNVNHNTLGSPWPEMLNVWNMLLNGPLQLPPLPTMQFVPHSNFLQPPRTIGAQCMKSSIIVIFDRFSNHFVESLKLKCCKSVVRNVVVVPKLNEFWLTQEVFQTAIVIVYFDLGLFDKEILRHFKNLRLVILADVLGNSVNEAVDYFGKNGIPYRTMLPEPDVDTAADIIISKILHINYESPLEKPLTHGYQTEALQFSKNLCGKILGIIGLGKLNLSLRPPLDSVFPQSYPIGLALARRCSAFGLKVVIYDSTVPEGLCSGLGLVQSEHLEKLLPLCHFLSFHSYWIDGSNYQERHFDLTSYKIGLIRKEASIICPTNRVSFDSRPLARSLGHGHIKSAVLTKEQIANLLPAYASISGGSNAIPNVHEINFAKFITEDSFSTHHQRVADFVRNFLCEIMEASITQPGHSSSQKSASNGHHGPTHLANSKVSMDIDCAGSKSDGMESEHFYHNPMSFSIDTLVKSVPD